MVFVSMVARLVFALAVVLLPVQPLLAYENQDISGLNLQQLQALYPNARFEQVAVTQLQRLKRQYEAKAMLAQIGSSHSVQHAAKHNPCETGAPGQAQPAQDSSGGLDVFVDIADDVGGGDSDAAVVFFVLVGVVVVAALVVYSGKFLYDLATSSLVCPPWWQLGLRSSLLLDDSFSGTMHAVRFAAGLRDPDTSIGLVLEYGIYDIDIKSLSMDYAVDGNYWLAGPEVRWYFGYSAEPSYWYAELLGGRSINDDLGFISAARVGMSLVTGASRFGFSLGALYTDLEQTTGVVEDVNAYHMTLGINWGMQF